MKWPDAGEAPARLANRMLADQQWAREKLAPFAGRVFSLAVGPIRAAWRIHEGGTLDAESSADAADLKLAIAPWSVPSFLADPARWNEFVREEGDADFGGALKDLARTMPWFVEETFAKALGPIVGQRMAETGRKLLAFPEYAGQRVADSAASYVRDEAALLVRRSELRRFTDEVAEIVERVDALEARLDTLAPRVRPLR
jgi:ubiquinone biosynthesis accessory factor UbiJ